MVTSNSKDFQKLSCKWENGVYRCTKVVSNPKMVNQNPMPMVAHMIMILFLGTLFFRTTAKTYICPSNPVTIAHVK